MLQTRRLYLLRSVAMIAFICLTLLIVSSRAQNVPGRSCLNTVKFLEANGQSQVQRSEIYDSLKDGEHINKYTSAVELDRFGSCYICKILYYYRVYVGYDHREVFIAAHLVGFGKIVQNLCVLERQNWRETPCICVWDTFNKLYSNSLTLVPSSWFANY